MCVIVTSPLFYAAANEAFARGGLSDAAARALLDRWATWHWIRTGLGALGFVAALRALHGSVGTRLPPAQKRLERTGPPAKTETLLANAGALKPSASMCRLSAGGAAAANRGR